MTRSGGRHILDQLHGCFIKNPSLNVLGHGKIKLGLHVTSIAQILEKAPALSGIDYFVYVLKYYQIKNETIQSLIEEIPSMQAHFAELGNAVVVSSVRNVDFANEVLSYHSVLGMKAEEVCPAILICTLSPQHFASGGRDSFFEEHNREPWVLLRLGENCETAEQIKLLLQKIVSEISMGKPLSAFEEEAMFDHRARPVLLGRPKFAGIELDHKALWSHLRGMIKR